MSELNQVQFEAAKRAAEASWQGADMSWEAALKSGIEAYLQAGQPMAIDEALVDKAIGYFTSCASSDMHDMMRAALEGAQIKPASDDFAAGLRAGEEDAMEALNNPSITDCSAIIALTKHHAARVHLSIGSARVMILGLASRLERVVSDRDSWRRVAEQYEHSRQISRLG